MVPFSFESITRSASLDAPSVYPVSDAARATHESFESHLQRATATGIDQSTRRSTSEAEPRHQTGPASHEPPRNEAVRQDAGESNRDDIDDHSQDALEASAAPPTAEQPVEPESEQPSQAVDEVIITVAAEATQVTIGDVESEVSADSGGNADELVVEELADPLLDRKESETETLRVTNAEIPVDKKIVASDDVEPSRNNADLVNDKSNESDHVEPSARRAGVGVTDEEIAEETSPKELQVSETPVQDEATNKVKTLFSRHDKRGDIAAKQAAPETSDAASKAVAIQVAESAVDTSSEDNSRPPSGGKQSDGVQPIGGTSASESTAAMSNAPSRFAHHLLARAEDANGRGASITNADQARFVDRVARAVQATGERGGTLRLRLSPPELGALTLEVKVQGGVVSARVEADTPAARNLLIENLSVLRERLAEHGMRVDQFDVDLNDRHTGGTPDGMPQHDQQHEHRPRAKITSQEPDDALPTSSGEAPTRNGNEQLNIIV